MTNRPGGEAAAAASGRGGPRQRAGEAVAGRSGRWARPQPGQAVSRARRRPAAGWGRKQARWQTEHGGGPDNDVDEEDPDDDVDEAAARQNGEHVNLCNHKGKRMMDDFTFPTTAAAAAAADTAAAAAAEPLRLHHHHHRRRGRLHFAASPLWFPSSCPVAAAPPDVPVADDDAAAVASAVKDVDVVVVRDAMVGKEQEQEDEEEGGGGGGGGEEEAMSDAGRRREEEATTAAAAGTGELSRGDVDGGGGGAGRDAEEKMDLLWENFNEELHHQALHQRVGSCPRADARAAAAAAGMMELSPETSDAESEPAAAAALRGHVGCAPMLRPSSRAGAGGYRRTATSWVLLMKIFRRLFVIEKTISSSAAASASGRHGSARR
uniref:Uncharacterized protein n=1 Tax=Oryza glumipatula TaxID=40148 RepID=A0A0D9ZL04_9ORYZ